MMAHAHQSFMNTEYTRDCHLHASILYLLLYTCKPNSVSQPFPVLTAAPQEPAIQMIQPAHAMPCGHVSLGLELRMSALGPFTKMQCPTFQSELHIYRTRRSDCSLV